MTRPIISSLFKIIYRPKVIGIANIPVDEPVIFAGNHTNNLDCLLLISSTKKVIHFLGKHTLFKGPQKIVFKSMGVISVDRTKKKNSLAVQEAVAVLNKGESVGIFPEGTINRTDNLLMDFKYGAVSIAKKAGVKIVPFAIKGKYIPFMNDLTITFNRLIEPAEDLTPINQVLFNTVKNMLKRVIK